LACRFYIKGTAAESAGVGIQELQEVHKKLGMVITMNYYSRHKPPDASSGKDAWRYSIGWGMRP